jgi:hypothetical protein
VLSLGSQLWANPEFNGLEQESFSQNTADVGKDNTSIGTGFWTHLRTKFLEGTVEEHFPAAPQPSRTDIKLHFDDRVVNSFSDHMVGTLIPMVYELSYHIHSGRLRVSLLLDYDELSSVGVGMAGLVELEDAKERKAAGDVPIIAMDVSFSIFNKIKELNTVYLSFEKLRTYRFWKDGKNTAGRANIDQFRRYVKASVQGITRDNIEQKVVEIQKQVKELRDTGELQIAFEKQDELDSLREDTSFFQLVEEKFNSQIQLKPEFVGNLVEYLKQQDAFSAKLELSHYAVTPGSGSPAQPTIQLIRVGRLDKALNINLPDLQIDYVRIQDRQMTFSGTLIP